MKRFGKLKRNAEAGREQRKTLRRVSEAGGRSFGEMERWSLVGVFDFVRFRVFRGFLNRRFYRGAAKVAKGRGGRQGVKLKLGKRKAEIGKREWSAEVGEKGGNVGVHS